MKNVTIHGVLPTTVNLQIPSGLKISFTAPTAAEKIRGLIPFHIRGRIGRNLQIIPFLSHIETLKGTIEEAWVGGLNFTTFANRKFSTSKDAGSLYITPAPVQL